LIPSVFGSTAGASTGKALPNVKDFRTWDPKSSYDGVKSRLETGSALLLMSFVGPINELFWNVAKEDTAMARLVATAMLSQSSTFVVSLCNFVSRFFEELAGGPSGSTEVETWTLLAHMIRTIFQDIHRVRAPAQFSMDLNPCMEKKCGGYLWRTLQAHTVMREYVKFNFRNHPSLAPIITLHLYEHRAPLKVVRDLEEVVAVLSRKVDKLQASKKDKA
jgi:hypothetical protein